LTFFSGCAPYLRAQVDLIDQSRKGAAMIAQSMEAQQETIAQFQKQQRRNLDDAFDADVRGQPSLDSNWVIDHRIAYSLALDALNESQHRQQLSHQQDHRTLSAINQALQKLEWLSSIPFSNGK